MTHAGVARMEHWTTGDYGGAFAGIVAALAAIGKGLAWLLNWNGAREEGRAKKLARWEASLTRREQAQRDELELRFGQLQRQNSALAVAMLDVTLALTAIAPTNPALRRAAAALRLAFPVSEELPPTLAELLTRLDRMEDTP